MADKIWIYNRIFYDVFKIGMKFESTIWSGSARLSKESDWRRAHEIWEHAHQLIYSSVNEFSLADGITNLKRSMNSRLQRIEELYGFKKVAYLNQYKGYLEKLEACGLVRPFIMKELLKIRNDIEHNDARPPETERCKELVDVVWYFLKSTDSIVKVLYEDAEFFIYDEENEEIGGGLISFNWNEHCNFQIHGAFPEEWISEYEQEGFVEVEKDEANYHFYRNNANQISIKGRMMLSEEDYYVFLGAIFNHVYR
jgi:hypothetical protein